MIKCAAKLVYDPNRPDFKKAHKTRTLIAQLRRDDLDLYYQWFLKQKFGQYLEIQRPMFGTHVTIVRGDESIGRDKMHLWKKYEGQILSFNYDPCSLERHWQFWSIRVESTDMCDIRAELGLRHQPNFHITIGRQYDWQPLIG